MAAPIVRRPDWLGAVPRARPQALRDDARRRARRSPSGCARPARAARAATARSMIDAAAEDAVFARARARCTPTGARFTRGQRGARDGRLRRSPARCVVDRPDRRLAQRQARAAAPRALDRGRRRARRWPTSSFGYVLRLRARGGVGRAARRGRELDGGALRPDARRAPRRATASSSCSASSPPTRAGSRESADALAETRAPAARDRDDRRRRCARSPRRGFDGMVTLRAAARSTPPPRS